MDAVGQASDGLQPVADGYSVDTETGEAVGPEGPCCRPEWSTAKEDPCPCDDPEGKEKTQKEVADLLGISQSYISRLEKKIMQRLKREMVKYS